MDTKVSLKGRDLKISHVLRPGKKETIVFLHGLGCSKDDFLGAWEEDGLREYTLAAFDFPGSGGSPYPPGASFSLDDLAEITHAVVATLGLESFVLAGHSMGGAVALLFLRKHPEMVRAFVNIEGNLAPDNCHISRLALEHPYEEFTSVILRDFKRELLKKNNAGFAAWAASLEDTADLRAFCDYCPSLVKYSDSGRLLEWFTGLSLPKVYLYGSQDRRLSYLPELKAKGCEIAEIPGSAHFPFHDNPGGFYRTVRDFLDRALGR